MRTAIVPPGLRSAGSPSVGGDVVAGLTVWAVLVPEALAYATIAGVPPAVGLYAAPAALVAYALLGSSRHLVVGPMAAVAALSGAAVAAQTSSPETAIVLTAALAVVVGVFGIVAWVLRLGFLASFISEPVLKGFIVGLALTIIAGQVPKLLGLESVEGDFVERVVETLRDLGDTHGLTLVVGAGSLAAVLILRRTAPRIPAPLVVVVAAIVSTSLFGLDERGVTVVGEIGAGLPSLAVPDVSWSDYAALAGSAGGILLIGFVEGLAAAKTYAARSGDRIDPNRELLGLGAANLVAGVSSGMSVAGSLSKTAVNGAAGARSQVAGLVVAGLTVVTLLVLTPLFENLPEPTLAAVVIAAVIELVDVGTFRRLYRTHTRRLGAIYGPAARADLIGAVAALAGVLVLDTLPGLFFGIVVAAALLVHRASRPHVALLGRAADGAWRDRDRHPDAVAPDDVVVVRPEGGLLYVNADNVVAAILTTVAGTAPGTVGLVVDATVVPMIDSTAVAALGALADEMDRRGLGFAIAHDIGQVGDIVKTSGQHGLLDRLHDDLDEAIAAVRAGHGGQVAG